MEGLHKIQKLIFEIEGYSEQSAKEQLNFIESIIKRRLIDSIDKVFDEQGLKNHTLKVEKLELDLGAIDINHLESDLEYKLRKELSELIYKVREANAEPLKSTQKTLQTAENANAEWLKQFLQTGTLPWWKEGSHLSKDNIKDSLRVLFQTHPKIFFNLVNANLKHPQFSRRLLTYSSENFIADAIGFYPLLLEKWIDSILLLLKTEINYNQITFLQLWTHTVEMFLMFPLHSRNKTQFVKLFVREVCFYVEDTANLKKGEAILLFKTKLTQLKLDSTLRKEIEMQFQGSNFNKRKIKLLSAAFNKQNDERIWLFDSIQTKKTLTTNLKSIAYRHQFITRLNDDDKQIVFRYFHVSYSLMLQKIYSFAKLLMKSVNLSETRSAQVMLFTEDLFLQNLGTKHLEIKDQSVILESIVTYISGFSAYAPATILRGVKYIEPQSLLIKEWGDSINLLEEKFKSKESKNVASTLINNVPENVVKFLVTGRSSATLKDAKFKEQLVNTIQYLIGSAKPSDEYKNREFYKEQFSSLTKNISILEIALIVDRIKRLPIKGMDQDQLLSFFFQNHSLGTIIIDQQNESISRWIENTNLSDFVLQYLLKFDRLPININWESRIFLIAIMLSNPDKFLATAKSLNVAHYNNLLNLLIDIDKLYLSEDRIRKLSTITAATNLTASKILKKVETIQQKIKKATQYELEKPLIKNQTKEPSEKLSAELEKLAEKQLETDLYIQNAGVVLLAPYLTQLFKKLNLLNAEGLWKDDSSLIKGVELIHFLTFGTDEMMEYTCTLNKIMVSMPISTPLESFISLTNEEKALCESLLTSVISNWTALKSSSIDNLRGSFLIREGRLSKHDDRYDLLVESKGYDILIDKIPWSFKLIKYKWMKKPIFIEWR